MRNFLVRLIVGLAILASVLIPNMPALAQNNPSTLQATASRLVRRCLDEAVLVENLGILINPSQQCMRGRVTILAYSIPLKLSGNKTAFVSKTEAVIQYVGEDKIKIFTNQTLTKEQEIIVSNLRYSALNLDDTPFQEATVNSYAINVGHEIVKRLEKLHKSDPRAIPEQIFAQLGVPDIQAFKVDTRKYENNPTNRLILWLKSKNFKANGQVAFDSQILVA